MGRLLNLLKWKHKRKFKLNRILSKERGTFGILTENNVKICVTLELPWDRNKRNISCIPSGLYLCKRRLSRWGSTFEIQNVFNRTAILFHTANTIGDLSGCIGVGTYYMDKYTGISYSRKAFAKFKKLLNGTDEFTLDIRWRA